MTPGRVARTSYIQPGFQNCSNSVFLSLLQTQGIENSTYQKNWSVFECLWIDNVYTVSKLTVFVKTPSNTYRNLCLISLQHR